MGAESVGQNVCMCMEEGVCAYQEVVTYMSRVKAFVTRNKIESSNQSPFGGPISRDQGDLRTAKNQH